MDEVLELRWLPINERIHFSLCKSVFKSINDESLPTYIDITVNQRSERLRCTNGTMLQSDGSTRTLKGKSALVFNDLPRRIRKIQHFVHYVKRVVLHTQPVFRKSSMYFSRRRTICNLCTPPLTWPP